MIFFLESDRTVLTLPTAICRQRGVCVGHPPPPHQPSASTSATDYRATMPFLHCVLFVCVPRTHFTFDISHAGKCAQTQRRQTFLPPPTYLQVGDRLRHMFAISGSHPVGWARAVITIKTNATIAAEYETPVKKKRSAPRAPDRRASRAAA